MARLVIIGAGGCGREIYQWARDINEKKWHWDSIVFLDDNIYALDDKRIDSSIIGTVDEYEYNKGDEFICGIGDSNIRKKISEEMQNKGVPFATIIHPTAIVADSAQLGAGVVLYPFALVSDNAHVGNGCIINMYSSVAHDSILGEYCTISAHCDITGSCKLGDRVFMGSNANIVPNLKIGDDVFVCASSTVMTKIKNGTKVLGLPARKI